MKISTWVSEEEAAQLKALAAQLRRSQSQVVRFALLDYIEKAKNGKP